MGGAAGVASCFLKAPFDVVKSRIQAQLPRLDGSMHYRHTSQALLEVARTEGIAALWKGLGPMCLRMALGMSVSFAAFDACLAALGAGKRGDREAAAAATAEQKAHE